MNGSFGLQGPENMEWTMHAKQRNPSRIQAQEVAQKGPECDAKVCLTRPSNPLKTLGPEPRLVCFIQRSNPIQTLLPRPRQRVQNGETPRCASPDLRTVNTIAPEPRQRMRNGTQMKKKLTVQWTASEWQLRPRLA